MDVRVYAGRYQKPQFPSDDGKAKIIYDSNHNNPNAKPTPKAVAFDLDETLGNFSDLYKLWKSQATSDLEFTRLLDLFPEFLRVGILDVLRFLKNKIETGECHPIYIYTNNQCGSEWVEMIVAYFEQKTGIQFARPICAYKIGNRRVEPKRTTHEKTYDDFVRCSMLKIPFELCFVDDRNYGAMRRSKVYYIQPPPYFHPLTKDEIDARMLTGKRPAIEPKGPRYKREQDITNKVMYYLREFFLMNLLRSGRGRTRKRKFRIGTRKRR
jgi:hypothetical protein